MKLQTISLEKFEVKTKPTKYVVSATADVWYDLVGIYHIYDVVNKEILHSILIEDNSKKFEEIAKFCFDYLMPSKEFELLEQYSSFDTLFKTIDNKPIQVVQATKHLYDDYRNEVRFWEIWEDELKSRKTLDSIDISNPLLKITDKINVIPSFLRIWSGGWSFDDLYIYSYKEKKFIYHFFNFCPYTTDNPKIVDTRQNYASFFEDETKYLILTPINEFQTLWEYSDNIFTNLKVQ